MKQELPFAVVLLAAGCLLWFWQSDSEKRPVLEIKSLENSATAAAHAGTEDFESIPYHVVQAEFQSEISVPGEPESKEFPSEIGAAEPNSAIKSFQEVKNSQATTAYIHQQTDRESVQLMSKISQRLASSQPFGSQLRLSGKLFGRSVSANGNYSQMGKGTYKSRIELKFGTEPNAPSVFQLCDGRFVYSLQTSQMPHASQGKKQTFEFVDLHRVQSSAGERATKITPTGWVATGGISSLFQHLASAFNFGAAERTDDSSIVLRGSWDPNSLRSVSFGLSDGSSDSQSRIRWEEVPRQLPHAVEMVLKKNSEFLYFPTSITFLKFAVQKNGQYVIKPVVTLQLSEPHPLRNVTDRFFVIDSSNLKPSDATDRYIARIDAFNETRQVAEKNATLDR